MRPLHILVVDDDVDKRLLVVMAVSRRFPTASVFECYSGREALEYFSRSPVDLIVTNHNMRPVSGLELVREIRSRGCAVPIVMVSVHEEIRAKALQAGVDLFLESGNLRQLGEPIHAFLQQRGVLRPDGPFGVD